MATNHNGQWPKGRSGNPAGRPPQSRNEATLLMESLLEGDAEQLIRKTIELGLAGDIIALRLCLDRLLPPGKDRPVHLQLRPIENVQQVFTAMSTVVEAIGEGKITPSEGETIANILDVQTRVLETRDLEHRVEQLEKMVAEKDEKPGQ